MKFTQALLLYSCCYLCILTVRAAAEDITRDTLHEDLQGPITLTNTAQVVFRGYVLELQKDALVLQEYAGSGSVEYTIPVADIQSIEFPGSMYIDRALECLDDEDYSQALNIMDALFQQRRRFLRWQTADALHFFKTHAEVHLHNGSLNSALQIAQRLHQHVEDAVTQMALDDIILLAYHRLWMTERADALSLQWIAERPAYSHSALGWYVQAELQLNAENYPQALDYALEPIVFSSQFPMLYLEYCYAVAILAAVELQEEAHARVLWTEMRERGLDWPPQFDRPVPTLD